jgi:hypothetical protein
VKPLVLVICLGLLASTAAAFWTDTPLPQLAGESDVVVIGRVTSVRPDTNTLRMKVTLRELIVLKGEVSGDLVTFDAPFQLSRCVIMAMPAEEGAAFARNIPNTVLRPLTHWPPSHGTNLVEIISPDSFSTNEHCAVLLKRDPAKPDALQLVREEDGKFAFNPADMLLPKAANGRRDTMTFSEFSRVVLASPKPSPAFAMTFTPYGPFQSFSNQPVTLILPR